MVGPPQEIIVGCPSDSVNKHLSGEDVVISGISGTFPSCNDLNIFLKNLYNKVDMVNKENTRWAFSHPEMPARLGIINGVDKFDAQFFRVHYKQAMSMEPMSRILLEHTYGAIFDSGTNPEQIRGTKVGVFIGSTFSESENNCIYETIQHNGLGITGCNKAMYANRISYWIDGKGPSYALDIACASSMACLQHAYQAMSDGRCDAAIVGGCNLCNQPTVSLNMKRAGFLCLDGITKCFDKRGDGYARSDAVNVLFLQKAKDAKRVYAQVYYAKGNYSIGTNNKFLPIRDPEDIKDFLKSFYSDINLSPTNVEFVEAAASGIAEADANELEAIGEVFAKDKPIKIGSVKSNMGHSEPASGVCSVTKVCLSYHTGKLPANLHYEQPQDNISAVRDGKVKILVEQEPFDRGFVALNSFSYSGVNIHVLLKGHYKQKDLNRYKSQIPHLVILSGRNESCVEKVFDELKANTIDPEQIALLHKFYEYNISGHMCRGFMIMESQTSEAKPTTITLARSHKYFEGIKRPIWFVYSGMGSQWAGMGAELMKIPVFAAAIEKCRRVLEPKGIDIVNILVKPDKTIYDNILNSFVGIAAVQIGLTDILTQMGIVPDNIIGHSVGELGCAYADGCFTAEEMILSAYSRGLVSVQTPFITGSMAAVGLGYKAVLQMCPPEIEVACHNSSESSTISGPADVMKEFVRELTSKKIFAKEVPCSNIAYHSRYIASAGPGLLKYLSEVITNPKPRSEKWVSTSVPQDMWDTPAAKLSSAEYHTNNLLNSVLFEETSKLIPSNAIVIEIAPHGLLQAILKRSLSTDCINIPLTRRGNANPNKFLLEAIGTMYESGLNPKISVLYPTIEFPVSSGTPFLSHLAHWEHSESWPQGRYVNKDTVVPQIRKNVVSIHDDDYKHFQGYVRNGITVYPEAALLVLVWETFAMKREKSINDLSVIFSNIKFHEQASMNKETLLTLFVMVHQGNNEFEVSFEKNNGKDQDKKKWVLVTGNIREKTSNEMFMKLTSKHHDDKDHDVTLHTKDIYKIMYHRGYSYKGEFQSIHSTNMNKRSAQIKWTNDWITFIDSVLQFNALVNDHENVSIPKIINYLIIDTKHHVLEDKVIIDNVSCYKALLDPALDVTQCGGIELKGLVLSDETFSKNKPAVLKTREFVPNLLMKEVNIETALDINLQIVSENSKDLDVKVTVLNTNTIPNITSLIKNIAENSVIDNLKVKSVQTKNDDSDVLVGEDANVKESDVVIMTNFLHDDKKFLNLHSIIAEKAFVLTLEPKNTTLNAKYLNFNTITAMLSQNYIFVLLKKSANYTERNILYVPVCHDLKFSWIPQVQTELRKSRKVVLVSDKQPYCGMQGLVKALRTEFKNRISVVIIDDLRMPMFNPENHLFRDQLQKDLAFNVLKQGQWGGYYEISSSLSKKINNVTLTIDIPGNFDSLTWVEASTRENNNKKPVQVHVSYAGPSYRDVIKAAGKINNDYKAYGMDFSGIDSFGNRVMGVIDNGSMSSTIQADPVLLWPVPEHWSLEDAATVPLPYFHAYYLLVIKCKLLKKHKVFIHGGAGALGQAVISICLSLGCTIFTTVSHTQKKLFLMKRFPELNETNIGNSCDDTFASMVIERTKNERCDIVINCASGHIREATMKCTGFSGLFLDLNDIEMAENKDFGMSYIIEERSYKGINLSAVFKSAYEKEYLQMAVSEGIAKGIVRPLPRVVFPTSEISRAFRLLSTRKHRGRAIIKLREPSTAGQMCKVLPRVSFATEGSFVVVCDGNSLGIDLVDHLVKRGARRLTVHIQLDDIDGYFCMKVTYWRKQGITVKISSENLRTESGCATLLREAAKFGTIEGIFLALVSSKEKSSQRGTQDDFITQFSDKALIVANLDLVSRKICSELGYFAVIIKYSAEAATAFVNSMSEKICQERVAAGFPALCLQIGLLDEENIDVNEKQLPQCSKAVLNALEESLKMKYHNVSSYYLKKSNPEDFIDRIFRIIGIKYIDKINEILRIKDFNISDVVIEEIKTIIKDEIEEVYTNTQIENLRIVDLKQLNKNYKVMTNFDGGLGAFYTYVDKDELLATEPMIAMPTKLTDAAEDEEELDPKATYLMLIPGFEGHHEIFKTVCERLKVLAMLLQLGPDTTDVGIPEIAVEIMEFMKKRIELKSKFYLLGYSFGVNIALELARLMEKEGYIGTVFCLDSSPDVLTLQLKAYLGNLSENELQNSIVEHMHYLMAGETSDELKQDLRKCYQWEQKVEAGVNRLRGIVHFSNQYKRTLIQAAYKRITLSKKYQPTFKLDSEIVLLKGIPHPKMEAVSTDYDLSKYSKQPVKVYELASDHALSPHDCRVSNIINKHLDSKLLENYKNKNLCETYYADPLKYF